MLFLLVNASSSEGRLEGFLHFCTFSAGNGVACDHYEIIMLQTIRNESFCQQMTVAFLHQTAGPVSLHAVSDFFTCQKTCSIVSKSVWLIKKHYVPVSHRLSTIINRIKICFLSQNISFQHVSSFQAFSALSTAD